MYGIPVDELLDADVLSVVLVVADVELVFIVEPAVVSEVAVVVGVVFGDVLLAGQFSLPPL